MFKGVNTFLSLFFFFCYISTASSFELIETPMLIDEVSNGRLPSIGDRVPSKPSIVDTSGKSGGIINILMGRKKDTRQLVVYGYARLVGYDKKFNIRPDILSKIDVKDGRIFTFIFAKVINGQMVTHSRQRTFDIIGRMSPIIMKLPTKMFRVR